MILRPIFKFNYSLAKYGNMVFKQQSFIYGTSVEADLELCDIIFQGISVICSKRGGDPSTSSHCEWLLTVPSMPDAINFTFIPITSLLKGLPGKGFLSHAINLYLRCKLSILYLWFHLFVYVF